MAEEQWPPAEWTLADKLRHNAKVARSAHLNMGSLERLDLLAQTCDEAADELEKKNG